MCLSCCLYYAGGLRNLLTDSGLHRTMGAELSDLEKFFRVAHMLNDKKRKIQQNDKKHSMYFSFFYHVLETYLLHSWKQVAICRFTSDH